jgi:hypothetical protein
MHARLLAMACLLYVSASSGRSESIAPAAADPAASDVDVYLNTGPGVSKALLDEMKRELASLIRRSGVSVEWRVLNDSRPVTTSGFAVVFELRGQCGVPWHSDWPQTGQPAGENGAPLASTAVSDGHILPFSWADCAALNRTIGPSIRDQPGVQRDYIYGRALARLLAHELYHVLNQTAGHAQTGIAKAQFTAAELVAERFQFDGPAFMPQISKSQYRRRPNPRSPALSWMTWQWADERNQPSRFSSKPLS